MKRFNPSKIIELRKVRRLSQVALSDITRRLSDDGKGIAPGSIWRIENGSRSPSVVSLLLIAAALETENIQQFFETVLEG